MLLSSSSDKFYPLFLPNSVGCIYLYLRVTKTQKLHDTGLSLLFQQEGKCRFLQTKAKCFDSLCFFIYMNQTSQAKSFSEPVNFLGAQSLLKSPSLYCIAIVARSIWKRRTTFIKKVRRNVENTRLRLVFSTFHGCSQKTLCRKHSPAARVVYISWVFSENTL